MESGKHQKSGVSPWRRATWSQLSLDFLPKWQLKRTLRITVRKPLRLNSCYSTKNVGIVKPFLVKQNKPNAKLENSVNSPILHQSQAPKHKHFFFPVLKQCGISQGLATHIWNRLWIKGVVRTPGHISVMWFLTSGAETRAAPLIRKLSDEWSFGSKVGRVEEWHLELLLEKHVSLKIWPLRPALSNTPWTQLSDSEWPACASFLGFQGLTSHSCSQKTYSQVTQGILSSRVNDIASESSQWRINCDCYALFPYCVYTVVLYYTVIQLPGQPHKYMTGFLKQRQWQKSYTLIRMFPVGASFKAGLMAVLANCPNQQAHVGRKKPANCVIVFFHK